MRFEQRTAWPIAAFVGTLIVMLVAGGALETAVVALVAGIAAILFASGGDHAPPAPVAVPPTVSPHPDLADVLEASPGPVLIVAAGRVLSANRAATTLLGTHIIGEDIRVAIRHPAAAERLSRDVVSHQPTVLVGLGAKDQHWEMRVGLARGGERIVHLLDQTDNRALERMRVDFVANASHELRTPLASILGFIETLEEEAGEDPALRRRFLKVMFDEAQRMQRLVDDLMSLSRIEVEKFRQPEGAVAMGSLIEQVRVEMLSTHPARAGDIVVALEDDVPPVAGDAAQLSQLLHNLLGNAMKYGRAGTPVTVTLRPADRALVCLTVADQGDGIAGEHIPRLTERFYRVDPGRSRAMGGTGLGLAIVKHIVERHRGRLDIASIVGEGTRVTATLPAAAQELS